MRRWRLLPNRGTLMISTDLHGNGEDYRRLRQHFLASRQQDSDTCWVILGDAVHAPDETARQRRPNLYDYADESLTIVEGILELMAAFPQHVFYVLGNHDLGHVGCSSWRDVIGGWRTCARETKSSGCTSECSLPTAARNRMNPFDSPLDSIFGAHYFYTFRDTGALEGDGGGRIELCRRSHPHSDGSLRS
jgi:hypothetical protein